MDIKEAVKEAMKKDGVICRASAKDECSAIFGVIKPTNTYDTCLLLVVKNGKVENGCKWWNPTADDLMADDWGTLSRDELSDKAGNI